MRYFCLISDYDGTLAHDGAGNSQHSRSPQTRQSLRPQTGAGHWARTPRVAARISRNLALRSGRRRKWRPALQSRHRRKTPPRRTSAPGFLEELRRRGVTPLSVGECIVATWHPHETEVLDVIRSLGLELQVIFNKEAVMILPSGVNKGTGVRVALEELGLSTHNALGCRRRRKRSRLPGNLRMQRRRWQCPPRVEGSRRHGHQSHSRRRRGRNHRAIARRRFAQPAAASETPRHPARGTRKTARNFALVPTAPASW